MFNMLNGNNNKPNLTLDARRGKLLLPAPLVCVPELALVLNVIFLFQIPISFVMCTNVHSIYVIICCEIKNNAAYLTV